jgi:hypothetical protein
MFLKNLKPLGIKELLICGVGMFFMGLGIGLCAGVANYGIGFFIFGLVLEIPAFYLVFRHKDEEF